MNKIRCTRNEMYKIIGKVYKKEMSLEEFDRLEFDIIPLNLNRFLALHADTKSYINLIANEETTDTNGNYMVRGYIGDNIKCWHKDKANLHLNYALYGPYGFYYSSGFGFNDEEMLIYTWCEGNTTVTLFTDRETYQKEREETEKWYEENT